LIPLLDPLFDGVEVPAGCEAEASAEPIRTTLDIDTSAQLEVRLMHDEDEKKTSKASPCTASSCGFAELHG